MIQQIDNFIAWYNFDRSQLKFKGMTPIEYRETYL
ncbi:IS3 family transposase [Lactococcus chungangensis]